MIQIAARGVPFPSCPYSLLSDWVLISHKGSVSSIFSGGLRPLFRWIASMRAARAGSLAESSLKTHLKSTGANQRMCTEDHAASSYLL